MNIKRADVVGDNEKCKCGIQPYQKTLTGRRIDQEKYWITPPELMKSLQAEFHFDYDPCPHPRPEGYNGLSADWGMSNWVNLPYRKYEGVGLTSWVRKAIAEHRKGKSVVMVFPITQALGELAEYGIKIRNLGRVRWLGIHSGQPTTKPDTMGLFILTGHSEKVAEAQE